MAISGWNLYIVCFSKPLFRFDPFAFAKVQAPIQNFHGIKPFYYLFHVSYMRLYGLLAQRDGKLKRGKKKKTMKNEILNNTANKKSKSADFSRTDKVIIDLSADRVSDLHIEEGNGLIAIKQHNSIVLLPSSQIERICQMVLQIK